MAEEEPMATDDRCCTIVPHFKVHDGKLADFKAMCGQFIELTAGCWGPLMGDPYPCNMRRLVQLERHAMGGAP